MWLLDLPHELRTLVWFLVGNGCGEWGALCAVSKSVGVEIKHLMVLFHPDVVVCRNLASSLYSARLLDDQCAPELVLAALNRIQYEMQRVLDVIKPYESFYELLKTIGFEESTQSKPKRTEETVVAEVHRLLSHSRLLFVNRDGHGVGTCVHHVSLPMDCSMLIQHVLPYYSSHADYAAPGGAPRRVRGSRPRRGRALTNSNAIRLLNQGREGIFVHLPNTGESFVLANQRVLNRPALIKFAQRMALHTSLTCRELVMFVMALFGANWFFQIFFRDRCPPNAFFWDVRQPIQPMLDLPTSPTSSASAIALVPPSNEPWTFPALSVSRDRSVFPHLHVVSPRGATSTPSASAPNADSQPEPESLPQHRRSTGVESGEATTTTDTESDDADGDNSSGVMRMISAPGGGDGGVCSDVIGAMQMQFSIEDFQEDDGDVPTFSSAFDTNWVPAFVSLLNAESSSSPSFMLAFQSYLQQGGLSGGVWVSTPPQQKSNTNPAPQKQLSRQSPVPSQGRRRAEALSKVTRQWSDGDDSEDDVEEENFGLSNAAVASLQTEQSQRIPKLNRRQNQTALEAQLRGDCMVDFNLVPDTFVFNPSETEIGDGDSDDEDDDGVVPTVRPANGMMGASSEDEDDSVEWEYNHSRAAGGQDGTGTGKPAAFNLVGLDLTPTDVQPILKFLVMTPFSHPQPQLCATIEYLLRLVGLVRLNLPTIDELGFGLMSQRRNRTRSRGSWYLHPREGWREVKMICSRVLRCVRRARSQKTRSEIEVLLRGGY